jgi:PhzF family phenazine biosynthesis protein
VKLKLWQVDAFAERVFGGNPAAVVPLGEWLPDHSMQAIAGENQLSETAFFVPTGPGAFELRWFTPTVEVDLCGHATLASAWVLFQEIDPSLDEVRFQTRSGTLTVEKGENGRHRMALPANSVEPYPDPELGEKLGLALGVAPPSELHRGKHHLLAVWTESAAIRAIRYADLASILAPTGSWALIPTAGGAATTRYDFISRFFPVGKGIPEDPVTGSAHCTLVPFWSRRLRKKSLRAFQASARGGELACTDEGDTVVLSGPCALYLRGEIEVP